jgi:hypothetical protein
MQSKEYVRYKVDGLTRDFRHKTSNAIIINLLEKINDYEKSLEGKKVFGNFEERCFGKKTIINKAVYRRMVGEEYQADIIINYNSYAPYHKANIKVELNCKITNEFSDLEEIINNNLYKKFNKKNRKELSKRTNFDKSFLI